MSFRVHAEKHHVTSSIRRIKSSRSVVHSASAPASLCIEQSYPRTEEVAADALRFDQRHRHSSDVSTSAHLVHVRALHTAAIDRCIPRRKRARTLVNDALAAERTDSHRGDVLESHGKWRRAVLRRAHERETCLDQLRSLLSDGPRLSQRMPQAALRPVGAERHPYLVHDELRLGQASSLPPADPPRRPQPNGAVAPAAAAAAHEAIVLVDMYSRLCDGHFRSRQEKQTCSKET